MEYKDPAPKNIPISWHYPLKYARFFLRRRTKKKQERSFYAKCPSGRGWTIEFDRDILKVTLKILAKVSHEKDQYEAV